MIQNKIIISSCLLALLPMSMQAQQIDAPNTTIDCGQVEFKHPVNAKFNLKNSGSSPLKIEDVRTSCGCTTVEWPRQAIAPGDNFTITATYDAKTMGHFDKLIGIWSNASSKPTMLNVKGVVVEKIQNFANEYPYTIGDMLADNSSLEFDEVNRGDMPIEKIHILNNSDETLEPQLMHLPNYLTGTIRPSRVAPGHAAVATLQVDSRKLHNLGLTQTSIFLGSFPGDKVAPDKEIPVNIILTPDFEKLSDAQLAKAPKLRLSKGRVNFGAFNGKSKKKDNIIITNIGKSTLTIRSIQMLSVGLEVSLNEQNIEPGESAKLKITAIASLLKKARSKPRILLITNDPSQSKVIINVIAK